MKNLFHNILKLSLLGLPLMVVACSQGQEAAALLVEENVPAVEAAAPTAETAPAQAMDRQEEVEEIEVVTESLPGTFTINKSDEANRVRRVLEQPTNEQSMVIQIPPQQPPVLKTAAQPEETEAQLVQIDPALLRQQAPRILALPLGEEEIKVINVSPGTFNFVPSTEKDDED